MFMRIFMMVMFFILIGHAPAFTQTCIQDCDDKIKKNNPIGICTKENSRQFKLTEDVGFGNSYEKSLWYDFKPYGVCIVDKKEGHPTRLGQQSLRFELRDGDCGYGSSWTDCKLDRQRHELAGKKHSPDSEHWYFWSIYLPNDFQVIFPVNNLLGQFHQDDGDPVFTFQNNRGGYHYEQWLDGREINNFQLLDQKEMLGRWNDVIINAKWTHKDDGLFRIWINGKLIDDYTGPTVEKGLKAYQKFGIYHSFLSRSSLEKIPTQVVYYDEVRTTQSCKRLKLHELGYDCRVLLDEVVKRKQEIAKKKQEIVAEPAKPKYNRTRNNLAMKFGCLVKALTEVGHERPLTEQEVDLLITGLEGNDFYRTKRHLMKLGLSEKAVKAHKVALLRLVNFEGTNEAFCAKPLR